MNTTEFVKHLSPEQLESFNATLIKQRDDINAMRDAQCQELNEIHQAAYRDKDAALAKAIAAKQELSEIHKLEIDTLTRHYEVVIGDLKQSHELELKEAAKSYEVNMSVLSIKVWESLDQAVLAKRELQDIYDLLGKDPKIAELKRRQEIDAAAKEIEAKQQELEEAIAKKEELDATPLPEKTNAPD